MYPLLLQLDPITISSLWVLVATGFFVSLIVLFRLLGKDRAGLSFIAEHSLAIFFAGLIGARLIFVIWNYKYFFGSFDLGKFMEMFYIWDKKFSFTGGIIGIFLSIYYFCKKAHQNFLKWLDIVSISMLGGIIFGNIGAFLDGSNYGNETSLPWGMVFDSSRFAVPIHPVQIYAAISTAILFLIVYKILWKKFNKQEGLTGMITIAAYSFLRFIEEFFRGDESNYLFNIRTDQIYALIAFIGISALLYARFFKPKKQL